MGENIQSGRKGTSPGRAKLRSGGEDNLDNGTANILTGGVGSFEDRVMIYKLTQRGISIEHLAEFVSSVPILKDTHLLCQILGISERMLRGLLKKKGCLLSPDQSVRLVHAAQVLAKAELVLGSRGQAETWVLKPALGLDGYSPMDMLINPVGFELVDDFLTRMDYGVYQ